MFACVSLLLTRPASATSSTTTNGKCCLIMCDAPTERNFTSWKPIVENIEARFDSYLEQENRVNRQKIVDNRVHASLYFIQPTGHSYVSCALV